MLKLLIVALSVSYADNTEEGIAVAKDDEDHCCSPEVWCREKRKCIDLETDTCDSRSRSLRRRAHRHCPDGQYDCNGKCISCSCECKDSMEMGSMDMAVGFI